MFEQLRKNVKFYGRLFGMLRSVGGHDAEGNTTNDDYIGPALLAHKDKLAIIFEGQRWTYGDLDAQATKRANWALSLGLKPRDTIAMMMENRPEFIATIIAMGRIGVRLALINTHLSGDQLAHCLRISEAKALILGHELSDNYEATRDHIDFPLEIYSDGGAIDGLTHLDPLLSDATLIDPAVRGDLQARDILLYIYTSGTTGLPKAVKLSHFRFNFASSAFNQITNTKKGGRLYVVLPLYHGTGLYALWTALRSGATVVLRRKFSATHFWTDCVEHKVTNFVYIGELMRYLLNTPPVPEETQHQVVACGGNGMRPEVWAPFKERFGINDIVEFYGATESNFFLVNFDSTNGSVGRLVPIMRKIMDVNIIKYDVENDEVVRGPDGFCVACEPGEVGEAMSILEKPDEEMPMPYEGYTDDQATEKKKIRDVFIKGDAYYRSGDLLSFDAKGYYYFHDRIGDTFRWKSENVSTAEVSEMVSQFPAIQEANIYGVEIPHHDGKAGMAAVVVDNNFDLAAFKAHVDENLVVYARPVFVRLLSEMQTTGTLKHQKTHLVSEGFDPRKLADPIYFADPATGAYEQIDAARYDEICNGNVRF